jgi:hypothetical protein
MHAPCPDAMLGGVRGQNVPDGNVRSPIGGAAHNAKDKLSKRQNLSIAKSSFSKFSISRNPKF